MLQPDGYREQGLRRQLVKTLIDKGIKDQNVLDVIAELPRHQFIADSAFLHMAYEDIAFPIGCDQTISQPYTVARQTELLEIEKGMKVLEIGTGSGYQTAVLHKLGAKIWSIERQKPLFKRTRTLMKEMRVKAELFYGDGYAGLPVFAPFDRIIVTCGAPSLPEALLSQLAVGGLAVIPIGANGVQTMQLLRKNSDTEVSLEEHGTFRFVPMLEQRAKG